ncbi:MAG: pyruvate, phosphate dikinase [Planctomycetaceae bacterium]|nr:pyruvate, phosphate dikinase [Planctomycetaceae bacterium]|tara:strand:- start:5491 stop:8232 length:2742 start_codon:yes stop_codon:yes gene_type:complete
MADASKYVYFFGGGEADGSAKMKNSLGGKGANLAEMTRIGVQVPAGFTIPTEVCNHYSDNDGAYPEGLREQVAAALKQVEEVMGAELGSETNPLLVSCRSGARESMPGMMDTVLNIGLNERSVKALAEHSGNATFAWDSYRRFVQMFGDVVLEVRAGEGEHHDPFEALLDAKKVAAGVKYDSELSAEQLQELVAEFKAEVKQRTGKDFPDEPIDQIWAAIGAVFGSWNNDRAIVYRRDYGIPHNWGTACNVQAMVFGNLGDDCATGVGLTRDCSMGSPGFNGDYLINAQGEDVVAGIRTPKRIETSLKDEMPEVYEQLETIGKTLENHYQEVQDIEFTVQKGRVWLLQTRNAKRTGFAAVRIAVDLVNEGLITPEQALEKRRIPADDLNQLLQPIFDPDGKAEAQKDGRLLTKGINAGPGAAAGRICLTAEEAERLYNLDPTDPLILVRRETSPEDLRGMRVAQGILTAFGGASSHAALVSRQMGKTCIVGCNELNVDYVAGTVSVGDTVLNVGDWISIDGFTGEVFTGEVTTKSSEIVDVLIKKTLAPEDSEAYQRYAQLMEWVDEHRTMGVRTNADQPDQAVEAVSFGAEGIGLCRTEHMFFSHLDEIREMILARDPQTRQEAVNKLLPFQQEDFSGLFRAMQGRPVTIRLLDPPLHEFLSERHLEEQPDLAESLSAQLGISVEEVRSRTAELHEENPMLGHRGCRLGIVFPEITAMQARAIMQAAVEVQAEGVEVNPEVMVPLVGFQAEIENQSAIVRNAADEVFAETGTTIDYQIGTMIEVPRAALRSDEIAENAEFFSFGTNDLTQTCLGMSRDDYGGFIGHYRENDIVPFDPFQSIDQGGVGRLIELGVAGGRSTRSDLKIGICGEHGGDPASVMFCHRAGLNYVSCSPYRVPIARLAAAQEALASE